MSWKGSIDGWFGVTAKGSTVRTELLGGCVTFVTMAYIIVVNPAILQAAGMPFGAAMTATILSAAFGTLIMGVYARMPFAIAPYMGENAFVAYTVCGVLGYSWQTALGAVFISGVLFTALTLSGQRSIMSEAVPMSLKHSFSAGIGLFIILIALINSGIVVVGGTSTPLHLGDLESSAVLLTVIGFLLITVLMVMRVKGSILLGMVVIAIAAFASGTAPLPDGIVSMPPDISSTFLQLDLMGVFTWGMFSVVLTMFTMDFLDTMGTLIGVADRADMLDEDGNLPDIGRPFLADSLATVLAGLLGTTTTGAYIESATGVEYGGRTGLVAVTVALLFTLSLFFSPIFSAIPIEASSAAMMSVGLLMMTSLSRIDYNELSDMIPAVMVIAMMAFTYNIGVGICAGFVTFPLFYAVSGRMREIKPAAWVLFLLCLSFFVFYPY